VLHCHSRSVSRWGPPGASFKPCLTCVVFGDLFLRSGAGSRGRSPRARAADRCAAAHQAHQLAGFGRYLRGKILIRSERRVLSDGRPPSIDGQVISIRSDSFQTCPAREAATASAEKKRTWARSKSGAPNREAPLILARVQGPQSCGVHSLQWLWHLEMYLGILE
jgi:hypothetical protein